MADDIQIKASSQAQNQGQTSNQTALTQNDSVIDLRSLDQSGGTNANAASQTGTTQNTAVQTANPSKKNIIALETEEDQFVTSGTQRFAIPTLVKEKFPDLIQLIQETESMNNEEREYWFQILPIMTEEQIRKFRDILINEKEQLSRLDKEYEEELSKLNEKHMIEWQAFQTKEKRKALKQAESASNQSEEALEEELLQRLSQV